MALSGNCAVTPRIVPPFARSGRVTSECNPADARVVRDETMTSGLPAATAARCPPPARRLRGPAGVAQAATGANQLAMMIIAGERLIRHRDYPPDNAPDITSHRMEPPGARFPPVSAGRTRRFPAGVQDPGGAAQVSGRADRAAADFARRGEPSTISRCESAPAAVV